MSGMRVVADAVDVGVAVGGVVKVVVVGVVVVFSVVGING